MNSVQERFCLGLVSTLLVAIASRSVAQTDAAGESPSAEKGGGRQLPSGIVPPRLLRFQQAEYPREAERLGLEAIVLLVIAIDAEGHVSKVEVKEAGGHGFDEAAMQAAQQFVFEPAQRDGAAIPAKILYRYGFKLEPKLAPTEPKKPAAATPVGELRGRVVAGTPPTPIGGVAVRLLKSGSEPRTLVTAANGTWVAPHLTPGDYDVEVAAIGYRTITQREHVDEGRVTAVTYGLESSSESAIEVTVRGTAIHREVTHYELSRTELVRVPGTFGDAIHAVEAMPSVARPPAFSGALIVRGSAPQDTQVFIEGTYIPRVFHFGSLSSVIPSEMIERLEFYPGNFSARYGRAMGGIIEVGMRQTNPDGKYHGSAQVDFINARANAEGRVPGLRGWSFMGGFRTSYVDRWLAPVLRGSGSAIEGLPRYYDYQFYLERRLPNNGVYRVGFFGARDSYVHIDDRKSNWIPPEETFQHLQSQLRLPLTSILDLKASWSLGRMQNLNTYDDNRQVKYTANLMMLRSELALKTGAFGIARIGTDIHYSPFKVKALMDASTANGEIASSSTASPSLNNFDVRGVYLRPAAFLEYELAPNRRINVTSGLRFDYARDIDEVTWAPRVSARYVVADGPLSTVLKGGLGLFYQPPEAGQTLPELGNPKLGSSRAVHSMLGVEQSLSKRVTLSVEGFEKELNRLIFRRVDGTGNSLLENSGDGRVVGVDLLLRYRPDQRFFGWVAYTLSRSTRHATPDSPERLYLYDQTHVLNVLASYQLGRGWEVGGRFRYMSGFLYNACSGGLFDNSTGMYRCLGPYGRKRAAPFHQLDLRIEKTWSFSALRISAYMDLINAYFHTSPDYTLPTFDYSGVRSLSLSLPILPSLGVRGEL
jgi:TonB family protein